MPELKNILIVGAGWSGLASAYWAKRQSPSTSVEILEKAHAPMSWSSRKGMEHLPVGSNAVPMDLGAAFSGFPHGQLLSQWTGQANLDWLDSLGAGLEIEETGTGWVKNPRLLADTLVEKVVASGVRLRTGFSLESVSPRPGGGFLAWSREGEKAVATQLVMATGGERNHPLKLVKELGQEVIPPEAAFVRLRLASPRLGSRVGPLEREVSVRCLKSGQKASGKLILSARGLEGQVIARLSSQLAPLWRDIRFQFSLEIDWLPGMSGSAVLAQLLTRAGQSGRRAIGETPLFGFGPRAWSAFLSKARVETEAPWARIKQRKLQALANRLKADQIAITGSGLPAGERAWSGGVSLVQVDPATMESSLFPGLFFAGEILDLPVLPEGIHAHLSWATAYVAGSAAALD